jgi:DNA-binding LytR/AlgR family response regulator
MNCLIIDDNSKTTSSLCRLLDAWPGIGNIHRAVQPYMVRSLMATEKISIVFIRVRLWDFRQFENLEEIPLVVFLHGGKDKLTTQPGTNVQYALREPYNPHDLSIMMRRIEEESIAEAPDFIFLRYDSRFHKTMFSDIEMIERKEGSYLRFFMNYGSWLLPGTLPGWLAKLPEDKFIRVSDTLILPIEQAVTVTSDAYEYRGRSIPLTFRFANSARNEMEHWPDGL